MVFKLGGPEFKLLPSMQYRYMSKKSLNSLTGVVYGDYVGQYNKGLSGGY